MTQAYELIVFDWDGTLMDSTNLIARAVQKSCGDLGLPVPSDVDANYIIGLGLRDALLHVAPTLDVADYPKLAERYRFHFHAQEHNMPLFDGTEALLKQLNDEGYLVAVATGKTRAGLDRAMENAGIRHHFHSSRCADESHSKPHPAMLQELMRQFNVAPEKTLMIGDTTHDMQMAINAEAHGVAVTCGAHPREALLELNPVACFHTITELSPWLANRV
jgi:phosphoglycolate phosphatase